jgi:hypothetical protein
MKRPKTIVHAFTRILESAGGEPRASNCYADALDSQRVTPASRSGPDKIARPGQIFLTQSVFLHTRLGYGTHSFRVQLSSPADTTRRTSYRQLG